MKKAQPQPQALPLPDMKKGGGVERNDIQLVARGLIKVTSVAG